MRPEVPLLLLLVRRRFGRQGPVTENQTLDVSTYGVPRSRSSVGINTLYEEPRIPYILMKPLSVPFIFVLWGITK